MELIGAYKPGTSPLHRMDNTARIVSFSMLFSAFLIASGSILGYAFSVAVLLVLYRTGAIPIRPVLHSMKRFRMFFITIFLMNAFFQPSENPFFSWWIVTFSIDGIMFGLRMVLSVILLTSLAALLTAVATPLEITDGLRTLLHPLSFLHIPVDQASSIISIAISFIPVLAAEGENITLSALSRGAFPGGKKLKDKAMSLIPLTVPLFLSAFRRADELSFAMEARGYNGSIKRRVKLSFGLNEAVSVFISLSILIAAILLKGVSIVGS